MSPNQKITDFATAFENFSSASKSVSEAANKLDEWQKELEQKDIQLNLREEELKEKEKEVKEKERGVKETEDKIKIYEELVQKLGEKAAKLGPIIKLNVGGKKFQISKDTMLKHSGSFFYALLTLDSQNENKGNFFIDRDPKYFRFVLNYLRCGELNKDAKSADQQILREEFDFFALPVPESISVPVAPKEIQVVPQAVGKFVGGNLLSEEHKNKLAEWLPNKRFELLYKASRDGTSLEEFHQKVNVPETLAIIQSSSERGWLFGGFTSLVWGAANGYRNDATAFIFTLTNPHSIPPTKYTQKAGVMNSVCCGKNGFICFGGGPDICLCFGQRSLTNFPFTYNDTTHKGDTTFTGARHFTTKELEVYAVV